MSSRISIGGLLLEMAEGWAFSVRGGVIVGRRGKQPGILRITHFPIDGLTQPVSNEACLRLAATWMGAEKEKPFEIHAIHSATGPLGSAMFRRRKDQIAIWYCTRPPGVIMGAFACPREFWATPEHQLSRAQVARLIATAVFDRISWGGQDELTKFLITHLAEPPVKKPVIRRARPLPVEEHKDHATRARRAPKGRRG